MGLNVRQIKFVRAYCETGNATRSAVAAGYSEDTAHQIGYELLNNPEVIAAIAERHQTLAEIADIDEAWVLKQWKQIAGADAAQLAAIRFVNCRFCRGFDGKYQWTENEYFEAVKKAVDAKKEPPVCDGGFGFNSTLEPVQACGECSGKGDMVTEIAETEKVQGAARTLFAGIKQTRFGPEIITRDQDGALANISKYLGMSVDRTELTGARGGPLATVRLDSDELSDAYLESILAREDDPPNGALQPRAGQP